MIKPLGLFAQGIERLTNLKGLVGGLTLLRGNQIHTLRLLIQGGRKLAVDLKLLNDAGRQIIAVFRQQFGTFQGALRFTLALAVELVAQGLKIRVQLLALLLSEFRAHPRQLLTVIGGELRQLQLIDKGLQASRFCLQAQILCLSLWRIAALRANATLNFIKLAAGVGLLLRKLAEGVGNFTRSLLLLLGKPALFQKLAADLQDLLVQGVRGHARGHVARFISQIIELRAQRLREFGEVVDNLLILLSALKRAFALFKRIQRGLE